MPPRKQARASAIVNILNHAGFKRTAARGVRAGYFVIGPGRFHPKMRGEDMVFVKRPGKSVHVTRHTFTRGAKDKLNEIERVLKEKGYKVRHGTNLLVDPELLVS